MRLYIDDDSAQAILVRLLRDAGHDVVTTDEAGMRGESDAAHLTHAAKDQRVLVSANHDDFEDLHDLVQATGGRHAGILIVRKDDDRARDLTPRGIVNAVRKLSESGIGVANEFWILNHWR